MKKLRLYLDTSVFGGVYDNEFKEASTMLFDKIKAGKFVCIKNYNSVNMQNGYKSLDIRSPKEVIYD